MERSPVQILVVGFADDSFDENTWVDPTDLAVMAAVGATTGRR